MNTKPYRPYQGGGLWGRTVTALGILLLVCALGMFLLAPFSLQKFAAFPAAGGVYLVLYGLTARCEISTGRMLRRILLALLALAVVAFAALEAVVLTGARTEIAQGEEEPEVMVIFGCQVKPWGPSELLQDRLDTALTYLDDHPDMTVVVSGGQGPDEPMSEAQCMYDYLVEHGVNGENIVLEDNSSNTWENIQYTLELFQNGTVEPTGKILAVSNGFHLARIRLLWSREWEGTYTLSTLAAPSSHLPSRLSMYLREPFALVKSWLLDR